MAALLWIALGLLVTASLVPRNLRHIFASAGWFFLSIHWFMQPSAYLEIKDYLNVFLASAAGFISFFIAYIALKVRNEKQKEETLISFSRAASLSGLIYFLFADVELLNTAIISLVTEQTIWLIQNIGYPVAQVAWNKLAVNGLPVEIILACTAIESMALFLGLISSANGAGHSRKLKALMISVPVIYLLNLIRVSFTASAYGFAWFGTPEESFHISEHIITKAGSLIALLGVSYMVLKLLPEIAEMIDSILNMIKIEIQRLTLKNDKKKDEKFMLALTLIVLGFSMGARNLLAMVFGV